MSQQSKGKNGQGEDRLETRSRYEQQPDHDSGSKYRGPGSPPAKSKLPWIVAGISLAGLAGFLVYSLLPEQSTVPAPILGKTRAAAEAEIRAAGLQVAAEPTFKSDPSKAKDVVLDTIPKPGTKMKAGQQVTLVLNLPPESKVETVTLPGNLEGKTFTDVQKILAPMGLTITPSSPPDPSAVVESTLPPSGSTVEKNATIKLVLAAAKAPEPEPDPDRTIPNVVGKTWDDAEAALLAAGFSNPARKPVFDKSKPWDKITGQRPQKGLKVAKDSNVAVELEINSDYAVIPPIVSQPLNQAMVDRLVGQDKFGLDPAAPTPGTITAVAVDGIAVVAGDKVKKGSTLKLALNAPPPPPPPPPPPVADSIPSPLGRNFVDVATELQALYSGPDQITVTPNFIPISTAPTAGTVADLPTSVAVNGVQLPADQYASLRMGKELDVPKKANVSLSVFRNPDEWRVVVRGASAVTPGLTLRLPDSAVKIQPTIGGTPLAGSVPVAYPLVPKVIAGPTNQLATETPGFLKFDLSRQNYDQGTVANQLAFKVEVSFRNGPENFSATEELKFDINGRPVKIHVTNGRATTDPLCRGFMLELDPVTPHYP